MPTTGTRAVLPMAHSSMLQISWLSLSTFRITLQQLPVFLFSVLLSHLEYIN